MDAAVSEHWSQSAIGAINPWKNSPIPPQIATIWTPGSQRSRVVAPGLPVGTRGSRGNDTKA